jgi:2-dehydro-3-deoxy-D-arabinonate dehydratase
MIQLQVVSHGLEQHADAIRSDEHGLTSAGSIGAAIFARMTDGLFRVRVAGGGVRIARGDASNGPERLLPAGASFDSALRTADGLEALLALDDEGPVPANALTLAPIEGQEVWAAGVTYERSREARVEESVAPDPYDLVYEADRPELFFKAPGWRVRGSGEAIGIRADSAWNVPEPELALVVASDTSIAGYAIGNDVSSRSIEGENTLYLPQAKVYDGACALGPCVVPASLARPPFDIALEIERDGAVVFAGRTSTSQMRRGFEELAAYLGSALSLPVGAFLLTGTGIVPEADVTLRPDDVVRISIGPLGTLENVVALVGTDAAERGSAFSTT